MHLKVGGRTSAIVPAVQKKTAAVAGDVSDGEIDSQSSTAKRELAQPEDDAPETHNKKRVKRAASVAKKGNVEPTSHTGQKKASLVEGRRSSRLQSWASICGRDRLLDCRRPEQ